MTRHPTPTVQAMGQLHFSGNVIPHTWYQHLTKIVHRKSGKKTTAPTEVPYLEAIVVLSDICYWYRPQYVRDEQTGQVVEMRRRFEKDKLQRSYQQLADAFGIGKDQARSAIKYLEEKKVVTVEFRNIQVRGIQLYNVMYVEPITDTIAKLNMPKEGVSYAQTIPSPMDIADPPVCTSDTDTETSACISPEISLEEPPLADSPPDTHSTDAVTPPGDNHKTSYVPGVDGFLTPTPGDEWPTDRKPPQTAPQETVEQRKARMRDKFNITPRENVAVPLEIAAVVEQARATQTLRTTPQEDGDPWADRPVREWCAFIRLPYSEQSPGRVRMLADDLRKIATMDGLSKTPDETGEAIRAMTLSKSCQWMRSAGRPTHKEFAGVLTNVLCGQVLPEGGNGRHDSRNGGNVQGNGYRQMPQGKRR